MVVGWQLAAHMRTSLVTDALAMAISARPRRSPARCSTATGERNTPRPSSPGSARPTASAPASAGPGCAGTTPPPRSSSRALKNEMYHRQAFPTRARATVRRRRLHRGLLQPPAAALHPRLPHPGRSTHRLPDRSNRCMINNPRNCPRSLTQLSFGLARLQRALTPPLITVRSGASRARSWLQRVICHEWSGHSMTWVPRLGMRPLVSPSRTAFRRRDEAGGSVSVEAKGEEGGTNSRRPWRGVQVGYCVQDRALLVVVIVDHADLIVEG